ncbi:hypothetical protein ACVIYL_008952 [Bradyrhizobium sp. USDA 3315]
MPVSTRSRIGFNPAFHKARDVSRSHHEAGHTSAPDHMPVPKLYFACIYRGVHTRPPAAMACPKGDHPWHAPRATDTAAMSPGDRAPASASRCRTAAAKPGSSAAEVHKGSRAPSRTLHLAGERRAVEMNALASQDLHLAVQRQIPSEFRVHHVSHEGRRYQATLNRTRQHFRPAVGATAYLRRIVRRIAGITSNTSLTPSPIL